MGSEVLRLAQETADYAKHLRRELHQHAETAMKEFKTTAIIRRELDKLGVTYQELGMETGCVALIHGTKPGNGETIAIRADIDALPMQETSGVSYASVHPSAAHACGHDGHTACLLGTAKILASIRDQFSGTVKLIFQPAEEGLNGAQTMLKKGVLENPPVDSMIALHGQPAFEIGTVAVSDGTLMASSDMFTIRFFGKSAHASRPNEGVNALLAAAHAVIALQELVSNEVSTSKQAVVNTCVLQSGTAHNVIPQEAVMKGTVRCLDTKTQVQMEESIRRTIRCVAELCRCRYEMDYVHGVPALENDLQTTKHLYLAAEKAVGKDRLCPLPPTMGSEDFAYFANSLKKTCYYRIGCRRTDVEEQPLLHNAAFDFQDEALPYGMAVHVSYVLERNG